MDINCKTTMSDDEEDLELLRMAALQTLKKPTAPSIAHLQRPAPVNKFNSPPHLKRGRGFHSGPGRGGRNGQFNGRARNSNLISITTIQTEEKAVKYEETLPVPKLILPQDRYCGAKKQEQEDKPKETSKFNRYDNSDDSESEDESVPEISDSESTVKLERSNSLEALMQELEYEISGEKPLKAKGKIKKRKRENEVEEEEVKPEKVEEVVPEIKEPEVEVEVKPPRKKRSRSPNYRKRSPLNGRRFNFSKNFIPNFVEPPPQIPLNFNLPYTNMSYIPPPLYQPQLPPPAYVHRPLSPLNLNTEVLSTITMAPLSPRSAAFVLQNREIIERRKKSPRRSYSRSPSPRFRRSLSPRRTPSPRRYPRSASPSRKSRKSPRRASPKRLPPPKSIQERLGKKEAVKKEATPPPVEEEKLDPILEARRKKFNEQEVVPKEKIIRLKPKVEEPKDEEVEPDLLDLDADLKDIFSDEESDNENEGRFKSSTSTTRNVSVLPFTKLVNGTDIKNKPLEETCRNLNNVNRRERDRRPRRDERRKRAASPLSASAKQTKKTERASTRLTRKEAVTSPIESKKIEIKIRNPSKYDTDVKEEKSAVRKVAVSDVKENTAVQEIQDPEVIIDEEEDDDVIRKTEGDLRAQLSRKRAERQHKIPLAAEDVQSRLLHNALQGAVFKKSKKSKRKEKETGPKDKLPIHLRLGVPNDTETKRKKKNKGRTTEQV